MAKQVNGFVYLQIVEAIQRILYAADDNSSVVAEAQAMLSSSVQQKEAEPFALSPIAEMSEERPSSDSQKRKNIVNYDVDSAAIANLSPRQKLSDVSEVHLSGSPLMTY